MPIPQTSRTTWQENDKIVAMVALLLMAVNCTTITIHYYYYIHLCDFCYPLFLLTGGSCGFAAAHRSLDSLVVVRGLEVPMIVTVVAVLVGEEVVPAGMEVR